MEDGANEEITAENFPEMVQVMNLQIEDSQHILSRVTKNNLNQDIFSQIREGRTPALGSCGPCTPMQLPRSQPDPLASEPGSTQGQGLAGGHSGATLRRPLLRAAHAPSPASWGPSGWLLPCPVPGRGAPASLSSPQPGWPPSVLNLRRLGSKSCR